VLSCASALHSLDASGSETVLVLSEHAPGPLSRLATMLHVGPVLSASSASDPVVRSQLATTTASGRADVVVADADARAAVKAVIRGGLVCLPSAAVETPSVTELVQREVTLVAARDVTAMVAELGPQRVRAAWDQG
jgi:hypothetical protein